MSIDLENVASGFSTGIINDNFQRIEDYVNENLLNRDGLGRGEANQMELPLDMNSHPILNAATSNEPGSLVTKDYVDSADDYLQRQILAIPAVREGDFEFLGDIPVETNTGMQTLNSALDKRVSFVETISDLLALDTSFLQEGQIVQVKEYHAGTGVGGGEFYWDASSTEDENGGTVFGYATQGRWMRLGVSSSISVSSFGAISDGIADDTDAVTRALHYAVSDSARATKVTFPLGETTITSGIGQLPNPVRGLVLEGEAGNYGSRILFKSDSGEFINIRTYFALTVSRLDIVHVPQSDDYTTWSCRAFYLNGGGGGNRVSLERVFIEGFYRQIEYYGGNTNNDTLSCINSRFQSGVNFLHTTYSQALINRFTQVTFVNFREAVFDIGGFGQGHFDTINVVTFKEFIKLGRIGGGESQNYVLTNVKGEYRQPDEGGSSETCLIDSDSVQANFVLNGSTLWGQTPGDAYAIKMTAGTNIEINGGSFSDARLLLRRNPSATISSVIKFNNSRPPEPAGIVFDDSGSGSWPYVVYENCRNENNVIMTKGRDTHSLRSSTYEVTFQVKNSIRALIQTGENYTHTLINQGTPTVIKSAYAWVINVGSATKPVNFYNDIAKTNLIASATIPGGAGWIEIPGIAGQLFSGGDGIIIEMASDQDVAGRLHFELQAL